MNLDVHDFVAATHSDQMGKKEKIFFKPTEKHSLRCKRFIAIESAASEIGGYICTSRIYIFIYIDGINR